ncbi:MAG TPA: ribonuclease HI family protein [Terracidiphilus sp.]|nr:ribonuclease HI family protein [Terracidiphilus sp.]
MSENLFSALEPDAAGKAEWYIAHCDGGSRGNPGPAGYGAVIEGPDGRVAVQLSEFLGRQTNNYAEYSALLAVLAWALEHRVKRLRVISDSELMVNQMKGRYKVGSPGLRPMWEEAKRLSARLERFEIRHTLRGGNQEADRLANEAMDRGMGGKRPSGIETLAPGTSSSLPRTKPGASGSGASERQRQVFEGLVKDGVVHLIEGELPDGILVKVIRE